MPMHDYPWSGAWMTFDWLLWLALLALLISVGLSRRARKSDDGDTKTALDLLNERYAQGRH